MKKSVISGVFAAAVLAGCSMAPTYERPEAPVAAEFPVSAEKQSEKIAVDIGWREFFKDARLQALIAAALENNRDLKIAVLRIEEARSLYNIQWADRLPNLNAVATGSRGRTPGDFNSVTPGTSVVGSRYDVGISLASFELDFFGRVKSLNDVALATYLATEEAQRSVQISLVAEVAKAYLAERAFAEQLDLAQKSFKAREESTKLAKVRFDVGATSALDLAQYESLLQSAKVAMVTLARQRALILRQRAEQRK